MFRQGSVRYSKARCGRRGMDRLGALSCGALWQAWSVTVRLGTDRLGKAGKAR